MTEQVLVDVKDDVAAAAADPDAAFEELRRALARAKEEKANSSVDPEVVKTLKSLLSKFREIQSRESSFLGLGLSPHVEALLSQVDPEWAAA